MDIATGCIIGVLTAGCVALAMTVLVQFILIGDRDYTIRAQQSRIKRLRDEAGKESAYAIIVNRLKPSIN